MSLMPSTTTVAKWDICEHRFKADIAGNPYTDAEFWGVFKQNNREVRVPGFYDGDQGFKVRFMPDNPGTWTLTTYSDTATLDGVTASFEVTEPRDGVHGPVEVRNRYHFGYADGTSYFPFGTTCYAWTHQPIEMQEQTLRTLENASFNKIRMCVFPKHYPYNENEPLHHVFEPVSEGVHDYDRPVYESFHHFETQIGRLAELGIEADIIIIHPYDRWGYCTMSEEQDFRYLKYLVARIASYRNVWWSLANEYDFLLDVKPMERWHRFFHIIEENDPYRHLKSIHQGNPAACYDHRKPWVDHVCIQHRDVMRTAEWRQAWGKPIINDEPQYEGNIFQPWGNITAEELVHRFWMTVISGGYCGHGETYAHPEDLLWWAKGGELRGQAEPRIGFLLDIIKEDVKTGLTPFREMQEGQFPWNGMGGSFEGDVRFIYFGAHRPVIWSTGFPKEDGDYDIDIIDTWNMTITPGVKVAAPVPVATKHGNVIRGGKPNAAFGLELPGKPNLAVRIRPAKNS
jgi:hypothetical protein